MDKRVGVADLVLMASAAFAIVWATARAHVQSITVDEADSYLIWVARAASSHWTAASNNHVLNSLLTRFFTTVFGVSHLSVRAPALLGAAMYVLAACYVCRLLTADHRLRWPLFVCLVYNPFVFDYLVEARGYGLALGFVMSAIAAAAYTLKQHAAGRPVSVSTCCVACSTLVALSFASNFSFGFANTATLLMIFVGACSTLTRPQHDRKDKLKECARLLAACTVPGLVITLFLSASVVLSWPKGQLWYGAKSMRETVSSITEASLYQLNPHIVNPLLYPILARTAPILLWGLGVMGIGQVFLVFRNRRMLPDGHGRWLIRFGGMLAAILALSLAVHWLSFRFFGLLLPRERTALYVPPLCVLILGAAAAVPVLSRWQALWRRGLVGMLFIVGVYFLLCLRLTYFKEWRWNADVKHVYTVLSCCNQSYGLKQIPAGWLYVAPLNFYRQLGGQAIDEFAFTPAYPVDRQAYVLQYTFDHGFIEEHGLKIVFQGQSTDVVVAVRPELETASRNCAAGVPGR